MTWTKWIPLAVLVLVFAGCGGSGESQEEGDSSGTVGETPVAETGADRDVSDPDHSELFITPTDSPFDHLNPVPSAGDTAPPSPAPPDASPASPAQEDPLREIVLQLTSDDLRLRGRAVDVLDQSENGVPRCIELLQDKDPEVRRGAAFFLLGKFDAGNAEVDHALIAALADEHAGVRHIALQAVNESKDEVVLQAEDQLVRMLDNAQEDKHQRTLIARRLGRLGSQASEFLPTLIKVGQGDADRDVRAACLYAVYKVADRDAAFDVFHQVLRGDSDAGLRGVAASRLGSYGPAAAVAIPDLAAALDAVSDSVARAKIAEALARIGEPALPALLKRFDADDKELRTLTIFAVGRMGAAAAKAVPRLEALRDDEDRDVRLAAELSIRRIQGAP